MSSQSKMLEGVLNQRDVYDIFKSYYDEDDNDTVELSKRSWVSPEIDLFDYELCNTRSVTSLEWSQRV